MHAILYIVHQSLLEPMNFAYKLTVCNYQNNCNTIIIVIIVKNKIEVLTGDEQNGMSHGPVQILTSQDKFSDEAPSLWKVIRETSDRQWRNVIYFFICYVYKYMHSSFSKNLQ